MTLLFDFSAVDSGLCRSGYESAAKRFNPADLEVTLSGRSFMITGANSGIGKATAQEIAKRGGTVHMVCRNKGRADAAKDEIVENSKNENVHVHIVDMSNMKQVWEFAQNFAQNNSLNVLITVSSGGMLTHKLNVDDLQFEKGTFDGTMAYAQNKRQQVILTERWAAQHKEIHFSSMHPGWADTPAVQTSMPSFHAKMQSRLRTEAMGADTVVWLAVSAAASKQPSGLFFQDRTAVATHLPLAASRSTPQDEEKLMNILEELAQKFKP
ncbi:hypothetical protein WMY93_001797 [Mugilogobius chulae]|uniref:Dehydrogenase/reductase (SDR family) member 12 n=1 Tax=Mugilogobius chulae TaxID=88201 RepID=A0AAW0PRT0_9GOBI